MGKRGPIKGTKFRHDAWAGAIWLALTLKDYEHFDRDIVLLAVQWIAANREESGQIAYAPYPVIERKTRMFRSVPLEETLESMVKGRWITKVGPDTYEITKAGRALLDGKRYAIESIGARMSSWFRVGGKKAGYLFTGHERQNKLMMKKTKDKIFKQ